MNRSDVIHRLQVHADAVRAMGATSLYLYGSTASDEADVESDLYIEHDPDGRFNAFDLIGIKQFFEDRLGSAVDITTRDGLHPRLRGPIERLAIKVF